MENSTITMGGGDLEVSALNENSGSDPRIIAITGSVGVATGGSNSLGLAGTLSVNMHLDKLLPQAEIRCEQPYRGLTRISLHQPCEVRVRIPEFVDAAISAIESFSRNVIRTDSELIFAATSEGNVDFSAGATPGDGIPEPDIQALIVARIAKLLADKIR